MRVQTDIKRKVNRNESYEKKNRGPIYMPRFVTLGVSLIIWSQKHLLGK